MRWIGGNLDLPLDGGRWFRRHQAYLGDSGRPNVGRTSADGCDRLFGQGDEAVDVRPRRTEFLGGRVARQLVEKFVTSTADAMQADEKPMLAASRQQIRRIDGGHVAAIGGDPPARRHHDDSARSEARLVQHGFGPGREWSLIRGRGRQILPRRREHLDQRRAIGLLRTQATLGDKAID